MSFLSFSATINIYGRMNKRSEVMLFYISSFYVHCFVDICMFCSAIGKGELVAQFSL